LKLEKSIDMPCSTDKDCISTYYDQAPYNIIINSSCNCGYNTTGEKKCNPLPGNSIG